ncbi:MAG: SRPBCC family protein [Betaproteobacteria bacterium]
MRRLLRGAPLAAVLTLFATGVAADVTDVSAAGFLVRHEITVNAAPDAAWRAVVDVGKWWNPAHSYSRDGANLSIDARPGGCFCEKLANGGGVQHMQVVFASPGSMLRMTGALGPLQASGVAATMTLRFTAAQPATKIELSYSVGGILQSGMEKMAPAVNAMLGEQMARLKSLIDTGQPVPPK